MRRDSDVKEAYAYAMLATLPAGVFLSVTGLIGSIIEYWRLTNVITQAILSAALVYLLGWAIEAIARSAARRAQPR